MSVDYGINQAEMMLLDAGVSDYSKLTPTTDTARVYQGIKDLRASRIRLGAIWSYIEPTKPTSDASRKWVDLDRSMIMARRYGLQPHVTLGLVFPNWRPTVTDFGLHCRAVAQRYGSSGMGLNPTYEIMNEVNNVANLSPCTPANYIPYLKAAYTNIKEVAPESVVISAGLMPINNGFFSMHPLDFTKGMYTSGAKGYFDALGNHPYSQDLNFNYIAPTADNVFHKVDDQMYDVMVANGDGDKQIWPTEIGFASPPVNQTQAAVWAAQQWQVALNNKPHWGPLFWFNLRCSGTDTSNGNNNYGVLNYDYSKRPIWSVLNTFNAGVDASLSASGSLSARVITPAGLSASGSLSASFTVNTKVSVGLSASGSLTGALFGRPAAQASAAGSLTATAVVAVKRSASLTASGSLTATADTTLRASVTMTASGSLTATLSQQRLYSYNFAGTGSQKPTSLFTDFGSGYSVSSNKANSNNPTPYVDGYYLSGGIYKLDQASADHFSECPTSVGGYGGFNVNGYYFGAQAGLPDRSNVPIVRSSADGSQFVGAYGHWGGSGSSAIFTVDPAVNGGQPVVQASSSFAWVSESDVMRLTVDGDTYTLTNTTTGATAVTWVDNTHVYAGATNRRTGFGLQEIVSNGAAYRGPGLGRVWKGQDVRPSVIVPPAPTPVSVALSADGQLSAASVMSYKAPAVLSASGALSATLGGGIPALLTATGVLAASVGRVVTASGLSASGSLTATGVPNIYADANTSADGTLTAKIGSTPVSYGATGTEGVGGASGASLTATGSHTAAPNDTVAIVDVTVRGSSSSALTLGAITASYGGVAMTPVGPSVAGQGSTSSPYSASAIQQFYLLNPPPGAQATAASCTASRTMSGSNCKISVDSFSYGGAGAPVPAGSTYAKSTSSSLTTTTAVPSGAMVHFLHYRTDSPGTAFTGYNQTQRVSTSGTASAWLIGDAVGAGTVITSSATQAVSQVYAATCCIIPTA